MEQKRSKTSLLSKSNNEVGALTSRFEEIKPFKKKERKMSQESMSEVKSPEEKCTKKSINTTKNKLSVS